MRIANPGPGNGCLCIIVSGNPSSNPTSLTSSLNKYLNGSTNENFISSGRPPTLWWVFIVTDCLLTSDLLSITSGFLGTFIAFYMSVSVWSSDSKAMRNHIEILSIFVLASSPIVMGTGIFLIVKPLVSFEFLTPLIVVCVNITMSLPFMLRALVPAVGKVEEDFGKLADSLNVKGYDRIRNIILPRVSPAVGFCLGIGAALSMGDLGVITLFSFGEFQTLPFAIYRLMVAYRIDQAFSASVLLIIICFFLFILFDLLGKYCATR